MFGFVLLLAALMCGAQAKTEEFTHCIFDKTAQSLNCWRGAYNLDCAASVFGQANASAWDNLYFDVDAALKIHSPVNKTLGVLKQGEPVTSNYGFTVQDPVCFGKLADLFNNSEPFYLDGDYSKPFAAEIHVLNSVSDWEPEYTNCTFTNSTKQLVCERGFESRLVDNVICPAEWIGTFKHYNRFEFDINAKLELTIDAPSQEGLLVGNGYIDSSAKNVFKSHPKNYGLYINDSACYHELFQFVQKSRTYMAFNGYPQRARLFFNHTSRWRKQAPFWSFNTNLAGCRYNSIFGQLNCGRGGDYTSFSCDAIALVDSSGFPSVLGIGAMADNVDGSFSLFPLCKDYDHLLSNYVYVHGRRLKANGQCVRYGIFYEYSDNLMGIMLSEKACLLKIYQLFNNAPNQTFTFNNGEKLPIGGVLRFI